MAETLGVSLNGSYSPCAVLSSPHLITLNNKDFLSANKCKMMNFAGDQ